MFMHDRDDGDDNSDNKRSGALKTPTKRALIEPSKSPAAPCTNELLKAEW